MPFVRLSFAVAVLATPAPTGTDVHSMTLTARPVDAFAAAPVIGDLADGDVLRLRIERGESGARATVSQCRREVDGFTACANGFPVLFDDEGIAIFQYQVRDPGGCGPVDPCVVVVEVPGSDRVAYAYTVFGGPPPPPPVVTISPEGPYAPGATVSILVAGAVTGTAVAVAFCADECDDARELRAGVDGTATASLTIGNLCRRCGVRVVAGPTEVVSFVRFVAPPTPEHSPLRLGVGLGAAAVLLVLAAVLVLRSDWRPPSEAATPELDRASLDGTSLDGADT